MTSEKRSEFSFQFPLPDIEEELDDGFLHDFLPYSNLNRWVPENGVYEDVYRSTNLSRLGQIKALSFLSYIGPDPILQHFLDYPHDRLDHSLVVSMVGEEILKRHGIVGKKLDAAIIPFQLHDVATPALGDATKQLDPVNLNEETHWQECVGENFDSILEKYGTNREEVDAIIRNEGIMGQVLDIADRITYTMKDTYQIVGRYEKEDSFNSYTAQIMHIISRFPDIGNIYKQGGVDEKNQRVFFTDPEYLKSFLTLRALMHQNLYLHPVSQGRDLLVKRLMEDMYSSNPEDGKPLNPQKLRKMSDFDLQAEMFSFHLPYHKRFYSDFRGFFSGIIRWFPDYQRFKTEEDARKHASMLERMQDTVVFGPKRIRGFDTGMSYLVYDNETRRYLPFKEYNPLEARRIQQISDSVEGWFVFYKDVNEDSPVNNLLRRVFPKT